MGDMNGSMKNEIGAMKKEFQILKVACVGLCLVVAYMTGARMNVGTTAEAQGALMGNYGGSTTYTGTCYNITGVKSTPFPLDKPDDGYNGPECTEAGADSCVSKSDADKLVKIANFFGGFLTGVTFKVESCASQGFSAFNREVNVADKVGDVLPFKNVGIYRK